MAQNSQKENTPTLSSSSILGMITENTKNKSSEGMTSEQLGVFKDNVRMMNLMSLIRRSFKSDVEGVQFPQYDEFVTEARWLLRDSAKTCRFRRLCELESPQLLSYARRQFRSISSQRTTGEAKSQIGFGIGLLPNLESNLKAKDLIAAAKVLEEGLTEMWGQYGAKVSIHPVPVMLDANMDEEELVGIERFSKTMSPTRFSDIHSISQALPMVAEFPYILRGVVSVDEIDSGCLIAKELMPRAPSHEWFELKQQVEALFVKNGELQASITPSVEPGNMPSMLRFLHFRNRSALVINKTGLRDDWAVTYLDKKVRMVHFAKQHKLEFNFPEESETEVRAFASRALTQLGLTELLL